MRCSRLLPGERRESVGTFLYRVMGAAVFDAGIYEAIETDRHATFQAASVVVLSAVAAGIGASGPFGPDPRIFVTVTGIALVTWAAWAVLTFQVGMRWLREPDTSVSVGELLRTTGFAASPGLLQVLGFFSAASTIVFLIAWAWMLVAMIVAVKHAFDFQSVGRAAAVCLLAAALAVALALGTGIVFGPRLT